MPVGSFPTPNSTSHSSPRLATEAEPEPEKLAPAAVNADRKSKSYGQALHRFVMPYRGNECDLFLQNAHAHLGVEICILSGTFSLMVLSARLGCTSHIAAQNRSIFVPFQFGSPVPIDRRPTEPGDASACRSRGDGLNAGRSARFRRGGAPGRGSGAPANLHRVLGTGYGPIRCQERGLPCISTRQGPARPGPHADRQTSPVRPGAVRGM